MKLHKLPATGRGGDDIYVDDDGKRYYGNDGKIAMPEGPPGRMYCLTCGGDLFHVLKSDDYETSAECPTCGYTVVVHDG